MKRINTVLAIAILLVSLISSGWSGDWDRLRREAEEIKTIQADFVQEKHLEILSRPLVSRGLFRYRAPGSLRWEYTSPIKNILIMHEGWVSRYTWVKEGFRKDSGLGLQAMQVVMEEMGMWMGGRFTDNPAFTASLGPGRKIVLTPGKKALSSIIHKIELILSDRPGVIESVMIYEGERSFTRIVFQNVKVNGKIEDKVFQF
ncbi:MAG TPA: outer membrane lipoprotein carrier protein LolA [Deltaproteobacteria bacterium]|nr:outer membrane lipoprotein carrier protein LolA [Deltaproteobacteria bacterium]